MSASRTTVRRFLGKGWAFPMAPDVTTRELLFAQGPDKVNQSIWIILDTEPGERIMRPDFGCGLRAYLMKPNTSATRASIQRDVERALGAWEPRIEVKEISVQAGEDPALVLIHVHYVHVRDGSPGNFVYPFYLE